jgi:malate dehydrogenase (quinone)
MEVVLVGGGIMSATLGVLLGLLEPGWRVTVVERLDDGGLESSHAWHNSGTGHAGLCEFNYTPRRPDGSVEVAPAVRIGQQYLTSLRFWAHLVERGTLGAPEEFLRPVPHMGLGRGADGVAYSLARYRALRDHPLFADLELATDRAVLAEWLPLVFTGRAEREPVAVTRSARGTDVDFGVLTRRLLDVLRARGGVVRTGQEVRSLRRVGERWHLDVRGGEPLRAGFVFVGAGGGTLPLLRSAGVAQVRSVGAFPISGRFLRTARPALVAAHRAKLYGQAEPGAPSISVPHLDRRVVGGEEYLLFGPFAAFSPRFLTRGPRSALLRSVHRGNLPALLAAARDNRAMTAYLVRQLAQSPADRLAALRRFVPTARAADWELVRAGQRVQPLRRTGGRGVIAGFGTELVVSAGGTLTGLLGASPGASAAVATMVDLLAAAFPDRMPGWTARLSEIAAPPPDPVAALTAARRTLGLSP